jgi:uncharacterized lipoprotein YmbA
MNLKTNTFFPLILSCCLLGALGGCFQVQPAQQYTLTTGQRLPALDQQAAPMTILVGPVKLASYLDQPRMVRRYGATRINPIPGRQWAGDLAEMISNKLVAELGDLLQPSPVYGYPSTAIMNQGKRVAIDILRFEGIDDKSATIESRWTLFDLRDKSVIKTQSSLFQVPLTDDSSEALATALSQGLTRLGQEIAESVMSGKSE